MIKQSEFSAFGRTYRTTQFAAIPGLQVMASKIANPVEVLSKTEVLADGEWIPLNTPRAINRFVVDEIGKIAPRLVLNGLISLVGDYSFGFLRSWRSAKVPKRFTSGTVAVESENIDPTIATLITEGMATMEMLERYYSLEDAFKMFDSLVVKGINAALSQEAATASAK